MKEGLGLTRLSIVNPSSLVLNCCDAELNEMLQDLAKSTANISSSYRSCIGSFAGLRSLCITNCSLHLGEKLAAKSRGTLFGQSNWSRKHFTVILAILGLNFRN